MGVVEGRESVPGKKTVAGRAPQETSQDQDQDDDDLPLMALATNSINRQTASKKPRPTPASVGASVGTKGTPANAARPYLRATRSSLGRTGTPLQTVGPGTQLQKTPGSRYTPAGAKRKADKGPSITPAPRPVRRFLDMGQNEGLRDGLEGERVDQEQELSGPHKDSGAAETPLKFKASGGSASRGRNRALLSPSPAPLTRTSQSQRQRKPITGITEEVEELQEEVVDPIPTSLSVLPPEGTSNEMHTPIGIAADKHQPSTDAQQPDSPMCPILTPQGLVMPSTTNTHEPVESLHGDDPVPEEPAQVNSSDPAEDPQVGNQGCGDSSMGEPSTDVQGGNSGLADPCTAEDEHQVLETPGEGGPSSDTACAASLETAAEGPVAPLAPSSEVGPSEVASSSQEGGIKALRQFWESGGQTPPPVSLGASSSGRKRKALAEDEMDTLAGHEDGQDRAVRRKTVQDDAEPAGDQDKVSGPISAPLFSTKIPLAPGAEKPTPKSSVLEQTEEVKKNAATTTHEKSAGPPYPLVTLMGGMSFIGALWAPYTATDMGKTLEGQTKQVLKLLEEGLYQSGSHPNALCSVRVYLEDVRRDRQEFLRHWRFWAPAECRPVMTFLGCTLPEEGLLIQIEAIAGVCAKK